MSFESVHGTLRADQSVRVTRGVLLSPTSVSNPDAIVTRITVARGGKLVFADRDLRLSVREIRVEAGGELWMGSETCRLFARINVTFVGTRADSENRGVTIPVPAQPTKGLVVEGGRVELHGKRYHPTWTRLARTARANDTIIFVGESVNWEVGQEVLILTSAFHDCPAEFADFCKPCKPWQTCGTSAHQNEIRRIVATSMDCLGGERAIQLDAPLTYLHYAGPEYQTEVALLSRRINFHGSRSNDDFGAHVMIEGAGGRARIEGVACTNCGQLNVIGRYPFHFHQMADASASYIKEAVSLNSNFRAFTVHGTNNSLLERNIAYNTKGFAFYLEDGIEENNRFNFNLAAHVHPIKRAATGSSQSGTVIQEASDLIVPADISASGFYCSNAFNEWVGNVASGGWSGFAFPNIVEPIGMARGTARSQNTNPLNRPTKLFRGNTVHSTGFYWTGAGSAIYVGARLRYVNDKLEYDSGRQSRQSKNPDGSKAIMKFEHTKTWAVNTGIGHWGDTPEVQNFECWDAARCAMLFGEASIVDALLAQQSGNALPKSTIRSGGTNWANGGSYPSPFLFQAYDTWVMTLLTRVTFRGYSRDEPALIGMFHSDEWLPQGINAVGNLKFENGAEDGKYRIYQCGRDCGDAIDDLATMSSMMYSFWDYSGEMSGTNRPSIVGSNRPWWDYDSTRCRLSAERKVWSCDWMTGHTVAYIDGPWVRGLTEGCRALGAGEAACNGQTANYFVGTMSLYSTDVRKVDLSPWPGVAGISGIGWHYRAGVRLNNVTTPLFEGAPSEFRIRGYQIERGHFLVLSVTYPAATTFEVSYIGNWWNSATDYPNVPMAASKDVVLTPTENIFADPNSITGCDYGASGSTWRSACRTHGGAGGPGGVAWFFDGTNLFVRVVNFACYNANSKNNCGYKYSRDGISIPSIGGAVGLRVRATCAGCATTTHNGQTFFTVPDRRPTTPIPMQSGSVRAKLAAAATTKNTCATRAKAFEPLGFCFGNVVQTAAPSTSTAAAASTARTSTTSAQVDNGGSTFTTTAVAPEEGSPENSTTTLTLTVTDSSALEQPLIAAASALTSTICTIAAVVALVAFK